MHGEQHHAPGVLVDIGRVLRESLAFAYHAVLQVTNLNDSIPGGALVLGQLLELALEQKAVYQRRPRRQKYLQILTLMSVSQSAGETLVP